MNFEWDETKNRINIQKHGIDFEDIREVFIIPMIINHDDRENYSEDRYIGTGILKNTVIVIVFTEKDDGTVRIISAGKADRYEHKKFGEEIAYRLEQTD